MFQRVQNYRNDIVSVLGNYTEKGIQYLYSEVISENFTRPVYLYEKFN